MAFTRWTFFDPQANTTTTLSLNPSEGGDRNHEKSFGFVQTTAPDGRTIMFEGSDKPGEITWKGVFLSLAEREAMVALANKRTQLLLTKDYGEQVWIYIDKLNITRVRVINLAYKASYDAHAYVLDIP